MPFATSLVLATAVLALGAVGHLVGVGDAILHSSYVAILLGLAAVDVRRQVIPNALVYPALLVVLVVAVIAPDLAVAGALGGAAVASLPFVVLFLFSPGSIGGGDVKMAALVGGMAGWPGALTALSVAAVGGGVAAALLVVFEGRRGRLPYGPFLAIGGFSVLAIL